MKAFDVITGNSLGGVSNREMACSIISHITGLTASLESDLEFWKRLAESADDEIELDHFTEELENYAELPAYCSLEWINNELRVQPQVELALEECREAGAVGDGLPDGFRQEYGSHFCVISDHGNVTLYERTEENSGDSSNEIWREIWGVV